ncbi:hypothetical protein MASR1M31_07420 [Porphyromonadaceae bacterium]
MKRFFSLIVCFIVVISQADIMENIGEYHDIDAITTLVGKETSLTQLASGVVRLLIIRLLICIRKETE